MSTLLDSLAAELERPRELSSKVANYLGDNYGVDYDDIGRFLEDTLPGLEDYELDLILSPLFTPKLTDQAVLADLLGSTSIPRREWPSLVGRLALRPTRAQLVTRDGVAHAVPLREVTLERYVQRLRLDAAVPEALLALIERSSLGGDRTLFKAVARRAIWDGDARRDILFRYLTNVARGTDYSPGDAVELLNAIENFKPAGIDDLLAQIPKRQRRLEEELNSPKPFFSERVQDLHGGDRDQRNAANVLTAAKHRELAFLSRLQHVLTLP